MENWHKLLDLLQTQTALQIGPNRTGVMAYAELFWLRQRRRKMKKMFPQVLMFMTTMEWMTRKENTIKKTTKPTILSQKQAHLQERKGKFHLFDSSVLKLNDKFLTLLQCVVLMFLLFVVVIRCFRCWLFFPLTAASAISINRKIYMIFPLVSCCSCVNNPSSS